LFSEEGIAKTVAKLPGKLPSVIRCNFINTSLDIYGIVNSNIKYL